MASVNAKVLYDYDAEQEDELTLVVGDIVTNIDQSDGGWWEGEVHGKRGVFPENFVEVIDERPANVPVSKSSAVKAIVTFDYDAEEKDELNLREGDIIQILSQEDGGWWEGLCNGKQGVFPSNFVKLIEDSAPVKLPAVPMESPKIEPKESQDDLISFDKTSAPDDSSVSAAQSHPIVAEESSIEQTIETKKAKAPGGMGFAISNADLSKAKLRPVSLVGDGKKSVETAESHDKNTPSSKPKIPNDAGNVKRNAPAPPPTDSVPAATEEYYKVVYDYAPENDDELALKTGDVIVVTDKFICDGWWEGTCNGKTGVFPNNFVNSTPLTDSTPKEKPAPKKPLLPAAGKPPPLPARESKDAPREKKAPPPKKPIVPESRKPEVDNSSVPDFRPPLPDLKKPVLPELKKPAIPDDKKPEGFRKPPPPAAKAKAVPPRPSEKPLPDETGSHDSDKSKLSTTGHIARIPSIGKKPVPPQPNGFSRTSSGSIKKPSLPPQPESKPDLKNVPKPLPGKPKPLEPNVSDENEEQGFEWEKPSNTQVLSNVTKNRIKGPSKALPAKYSQPKDQSAEDSSLPPWKKEILQKEQQKTQEGKEKKSQIQTQPAKSNNLSTSSVVESTTAQTVDSKAIEDLRAQLKSMSDGMEDMEKKLLKRIMVLTDDLDEERKLRASLSIEVDRLKKQIAILGSQ